VTFHPGYLAFCRDWDVQPRACAPYRARTKGKVESGVKFVKRNALAGRTFASFAALQQHLVQWTDEADQLGCVPQSGVFGTFRARGSIYPAAFIATNAPRRPRVAVAVISKATSARRALTRPR
jgi:hypothetical protein